MRLSATHRWRTVLEREENRRRPLRSLLSAPPGESGAEIVARLNRDLLPTLMKGLMFWPMCDFLTYKVIPVHLQPLINSCFSYIWTIYLTYVASLKKASID